MQFTRLRLTGFKSFVDTTELLIEPGLTGVVGPNGCGKSNLVEALRWVMGETSAKSLRGSGMEDVIFSGTSNRPSRNMAEVVLSLDNADRRAPAAFNEHEQLDISRRIERDSGSSYRVNGKDVRAKDVQLLFADLSSGAHSTSLVRQGQIALLVNAKPQNRRMILEEAAGIAGLHSRRHEAELRLRAAETNLTRVDDVLQELEAQLATLKKQARQATRYRNLSSNLRKAEAMVLFLRWRDASEAVMEGEEGFRELEQRVAQLAEENARASRLQTDAHEGLPQLREEEAAAAAALHRLKVEQDSLEAEERRAREEVSRLTGQLAQISTDRTREEEALGDGARELEKLTAERENLEAARDGQGDRESEAEEALSVQAQALSEAEAELEKATGEAADHQARVSSLKKHREELSLRQGRAERELEKVQGEMTGLEAESGSSEALEAARDELSAHEATLAEAEEAAQAGEQTRVEAQAREQASLAPLQDADRSVSALKAESETLTRLLATADTDLWPPLVDAIDVTAGYEAALGAALGDDLDVPLDEAAPMHWASLEPLEDPQALPAEAQPLSELVFGPPALQRRLSQTGVVDDREGKALQTALRPGQRLVSRDGDLWRWDGLTVAADAPTPAAVRLAQRNRLADLEQDLAAAESTAREAREAYHTARREAEEAGAGEKDARQTVRDAQTKLAGARSRLADLEKKASRHATRIGALTEARQRLTVERDETLEALEAATRELEAAEDRPELASAVAALKDRVHALRLEVSEQRAAFEALRRETAARNDRLAAIDTAQALWQSRRDKAGAQLELLAERQEETHAALEAATGKPEEIEAKRLGLIEGVEAAESRRRLSASRLQEAENRLREADGAAKSLQADLATAREDRARQEATLQGLAARVEDVAARIDESFECPPEKILETGGVEEDEELPPLEEIERRLDRLKRERENMGAVNLRADEEAQEYLERLESMNAERDDLLQAIARLRHGISDLNKEGRDRLIAAFDVVNGHFTRLFTDLFGGGTAHLELVESDDPLEAGLEIFARPPGKKLTSLSLLSGGEQALTAMSLIFAVFLSNPAPICVLDEVDAPLDDTNVERFCSMLERITAETGTRFLIITHHALTMSRMGRLFGVTMAERGVSQLVSVDLQEAEQIVAAE